MEYWSVMMMTMLTNMHTTVQKKQSEMTWRLALLAKYRTTYDYGYE